MLSIRLVTRNPPTTLIEANTIARNPRIVTTCSSEAIASIAPMIESGTVNTINFDRDGSPLLTIRDSFGRFLTGIGLSQVQIINDGL